MGKQKREEWIVCGRVIGSATGWDQSETFSLNLYDFKPASGCALPEGVPFISFETGKIEYFDDHGKVTHSFDLVDTLANLPRKQPK